MLLCGQICVRWVFGFGKWVEIRGCLYLGCMLGCGASNESPIFGLGEIDTWVIGASVFLVYVSCVNL